MIAAFGFEMTSTYNDSEACEHTLIHDFDLC